MLGQRGGRQRADRDGRLEAYPLRPFGAMQMTFMNASLRASAPPPSSVAQA